MPGGTPAEAAASRLSQAVFLGSDPSPTLLNYSKRTNNRAGEKGHGPMSEEVTRIRSGAFEVGQGPVRMRVTKTGPQESTIEIRVEYDKAEVPSRAYYADFSDVIRGRAGISLIFGKLKPGTSVLRNKVEIVFPEELFVRQLWKSSRALHEKARGEFEKRPLQPIEDFTDTDLVQAFRANNVMMMGATEESLFDFYHIAPTDVHYAFLKKKTEIPLDPVIRIVLATRLVFEFLEKCRTIAEQLPDFQRIMESE